METPLLATKIDEIKTRQSFNQRLDNLRIPIFNGIVNIKMMIGTIKVNMYRLASKIKTTTQNLNQWSIKILNSYVQ